MLGIKETPVLRQTLSFLSLRWIGLAAALAATPTVAAAQFTGYSCNGLTCTYPAGTYTLGSGVAVTTSSSYSFTNLGTFNVPLSLTGSNSGLISLTVNGANGSDSDDKDKAPGSRRRGHHQ
jgi:hypothetical protein